MGSLARISLGTLPDLWSIIRVEVARIEIIPQLPRPRTLRLDVTR